MYSIEIQHRFTQQWLRYIVRSAFIFALAFGLGGCVSAKHAPTENQILVSQFTQGGLVAKETPRGVVIYLPSVMFKVGSAVLSESAVDKVAYIAKISNSSLARLREILIEGHTDSIGSEASNMRLSKDRANAVRQMLIGNAMDAGRVEARWFGETQPLLPNTHSDGSDDPEARAANRRVEFILLNP